MSLNEDRIESINKAIHWFKESSEAVRQAGGHPIILESISDHLRMTLVQNGLVLTYKPLDRSS